jgi:hypothetical protein
MYDETLDAMGISRAQLHPSGPPFHGIVLGKRALPLRQINLPVTFRDPSNFRKETLTLEVVGSHSTYHALLGWPCYVKFIAIPNYTYLKIKMSGPNKIINVRTTYWHTYECNIECCKYAEAIIESEALVVDLEVRLREAPDPKWYTGSFEPFEGVKESPSTPAAPTARRCVLAPP